MTAAELSRFLFSPVLLVAYTGAAVAYFVAMARRVDRDGTVVAGNRAMTVGHALTVVGLLVHVAHLVTRMVAAGRIFPLGNMFEFSSVMALTAVLVGVWFVQVKVRRPELTGLVHVAALITLALSIQVYAEPGPLAPILDSWWLAIHVSAISVAFGVLTLGTVFIGLQLLRGTAEKRVSELAAGDFGPASVGAAQAPPVDEEDDTVLATVRERIGKDDGSRLDDDVEVLDDRDALRQVLATRWLGITFPWPVAIGVALAALVFSLVFQDPLVSVAITLGAVLVVGVLWWSVPYTPSADQLDSMAYRTIAFGFPLLTFAIITGAIWAEQSWGRYWGWDPKETSAFLTWLAYASYLHARATRGFRGAKAAWVGLLSFGVLLFTYFAVNLLITGLHSYAGL